MPQQLTHWENTLENAQRVAGQTNRLVLIYFWSQQCVYCKRMEADVLSQPSVAAELNADYVPVKVNADLFPTMAQHYGVTALPTTAVVSPDGQLLVGIRGWIDAGEYAAKLNQVAADARQRRAAIPAQIPGGPAAPPASPPSNSNNSIPPGLPPYGQPVGSIAAPPAGQSPAPVVPGPAYGASPYGVPPNGAPAAPTAGSRYDTPAPRNPGSLSPPAGGQPFGPPQGNPPFGPPQGNLQQGNQPFGPPQGNPPFGPPQGNTSFGPPPGNPPFALDEFCPVSLCEKQKWVKGDPRWGMIHRGRTYLFAGPEEQRRFYANPDRYAPVVSGSDVVLAAELGRIVPGTRQHGVFYQGRVYLFSSEASLQKFSLNPAAFDPNRALEALRSSANPGLPLR
jgi:YHS domain-containing protein/thiol-disulfide isomerase/thioredoxin